MSTTDGLDQVQSPLGIIDVPQDDGAGDGHPPALREGLTALFGEPPDDFGDVAQTSDVGGIDRPHVAGITVQWLALQRPQPEQHVAQHLTDLRRIGHVVELIGGASVVLIHIQDVSVHPFHAGDEVVDPVVDPVMSQRILVTLSETIQRTRTFCFMKYVVRY